MTEICLPVELSEELMHGLYIEEHLAIGWRIPASTQTTRWELLRAAIVLESIPTVERDEPKDLGPEFARLEAKVDVLLALLTQLVHVSAKPPEPTLCRLSKRGLVWQSSKDLTPPTELSLEIHLHEMIAVPLLIGARIIACHPRGETYWIEAHFHFTDTETQDLLERWIFLRHRKQIAARLAQL